MIDVVEKVAGGEAHHEWHWIVSERRGHKLFIAVMRDAMKFDRLPRINWHRDDDAPSYADYGVGDAHYPFDVFDGVRLPASAFELQQIADMVGGMLLTPRVVDLIWLQAGLRFNSIVNSGKPSYHRLADVDVTAAHVLIERQIGELGGDDRTKLVSCIGKYWCLINELAAGFANGQPLLWGNDTACNYGWCGDNASGPGLTAGVKCWQRPGFKHPNSHYDPSQTIRLMFRMGWLVRPDDREGQPVDLETVAADPALAFLLTHDSKSLKYLRQRQVPERELVYGNVVPPVTTDVPMVLMAPVVITEELPA